MLKKVYVLTMHYINNYGSVLQTYATQNFFEKVGYECRIIDYTRENCTKEYLNKKVFFSYKNSKGIKGNPLYGLCRYTVFGLKYSRYTRLFDAFRKEYLHLTETKKKEQLYEDFNEECVYVVGSDQMWNYEYNGGLLKEYYLNFVHSGIKVSFSSSIGKMSFDSAEESKVAELLSDFRVITVREKSAVQALNEIGIKDGVQVLDPTLLIDKNEWISALSLKTIDSDYVLVYQLNQNEGMLDFAVDLGLKNKCKVLKIDTLSNNSARPEITRVRSCNPIQFCELLLNARYVVTDSFHGVAFSCNFHKEFFAFYPPKYSTRIESILSLLSLEERHICEGSNYNFANIGKINYDSVDIILRNERKKVLNIFMKINEDFFGA